jgi:hypothetical protein
MEKMQGSNKGKEIKAKDEPERTVDQTDSAE